jgi:hypothetical protein
MQSSGSRDSSAATVVPAVEDEIVELLTTWGAAASPDSGALLRALSGTPTTPELLRGVLEAGAGVLPPPLLGELDQVARIVDAGGSLAAPSLRVRLDRILGQAREHLAPAIAELGRGIAADLRPWALTLAREELAGALQALWRGERSTGLAEQLDSLRGMREVESLLAAKRGAFEADLRQAASAPEAAGAGGGIAPRARQALEEGDPLRIYLARAALHGSRDRDRRRASSEALQDARRRLTDSIARARREARGPEPGPHGELVRLRDAIVEGAARLLESGSPDGGEAAESLLPAFDAWERALSGLLEPKQRAEGSGPEARLTLARSYEAELAVLQSHLAALSGPDGDAFAAQASAALEAVRRAVPEGGPPFEEALGALTGLLQRARDTAAAGFKGLADRVSVSASHLKSLLEQSAEKLPTAGVLAARLHVDQVDGLVAARDLAALTSLQKLLDEDMAEMRRLLSIDQRRRADRLEAARDTLLEEIGRLTEVASSAPGRRLQALAAQVEKCDRDSLESLRARVDRLGDRIRHAIRLEAGRALFAANTWLKKAGGRDRHRERAAALTEQAEELSRALLKGDLPPLRERTVAVRSALRRNAPLTRLEFRLAIAALLVAAFFAAAFAARTFLNQPQTYVFRLDSEPAGEVDIWLVRNGRIIDRGRFDGGDPAISFRLEKGLYEVFVNERYTGRVVRVPDDPKEVTGIPIPAR